MIHMVIDVNVIMQHHAGVMPNLFTVHALTECNITAYMATIGKATTCGKGMMMMHHQNMTPNNLHGSRHQMYWKLSDYNKDMTSIQDSYLSELQEMQLITMLMQKYDLTCTT